jgi:hypothetical protein
MPLLSLAASAPLPVRVLLGIYLGVLTGIIPALVAWALALLFRAVTGLTVPSFAVVVLGVAIAGVSGGFLAFNDPSIVQSANSVTLVTALLVVMLVAFYAHNLGDTLGASLPNRFSLSALRSRGLSADVVEFVSGRGQVRVRVVGPVADLEGYPPLPEELRAELGAASWTFPADLSLAALEERVAERLHTEFELADVSVSVDERARATVAAAPPASVLSGRVPADRRAVSVEGLLPTGVARGDEVTVLTEGAAVEGVVVSARSGPSPAPPAASDGGASEGDAAPATKRAPATTGGEGRVTVAVARGDAPALLAAERGRVVVASRGSRREFELVSLLGRAGQQFRRGAVREGGALDGTTLGAANVRAQYGVAVLAVRSGGSWTLDPPGGAQLSAGDELFAVGRGDALKRFAEVLT